MQAAARGLDHLAGCGWFWAWAIVGLGVALGGISFALGPLVLLPSLGIAAVLASSARIRQSAFGLMTGAGAVCLFVAWVQRRGPGTVCWRKELSSGCDQYLDPRPWLAIGLALFLGGILAHAIRSRRSG
jgi:hypothetical protein